MALTQRLRTLIPGLGGSANEAITFDDVLTWSGAAVHSGLLTSTGGMTVSAGAANFTGATVTLPAGATLGAGSVLAANMGAGSVLEAALDPAVNLTLNAKRTAHYRATFAVNGAGASPIVMTGPALPNHAVVTAGGMRVNTSPTTSTNWAIQLVAANDIVTSAAISGAPWSTTGLKVIIPVPQTNTTWPETTNGTSVPNIVYTGTAPGAYDIEVWLDYIVLTA